MTWKTKAGNSLITVEYCFVVFVLIRNVENYSVIILVRFLILS